MKYRFYLTLGCLISMLFCPGCSVKEDRSTCPCRLELDFSEIDTTLITYADLYVSSEDALILSERLEAEDFRDDLIIETPKGGLTIGVWNGAGNIREYGGFDIPYGEDCPPVYFHSTTVRADEESVREVVRMRKNHCVMTVMLGWNDEQVDDVVLVGNVNGYDADGSPSIGDFSYELELDDDGWCTAVLPRQLDESLALEVNDGSGSVKRFALGEYIAESGYDWTEPDLRDLTIELDFAILKISLIIQGWDITHIFDVVI